MTHGALTIVSRRLRKAAPIEHRTKDLGKPLARLLSVLIVSTKQASFHRSASSVDPEKHGWVWHIHGVVRADHVVSTLWSTSELTVYLHVHRLTSGLKRGTGRDHGYKRGMADAITSRVRARLPILRLLHLGIPTFRQAP